MFLVSNCVCLVFDYFCGGITRIKVLTVVQRFAVEYS